MNFFETQDLSCPDIHLQKLCSTYSLDIFCLSMRLYGHVIYICHGSEIGKLSMYWLISGMWTARNIFIATLAVADSSLCLFAMPMTLVGVLTKYWPFGPQTWLLCKLARSTPAVTIFFSSYTMVVIAIDRQRFIVHSTRRQVSVW